MTFKVDLVICRHIVFWCCLFIQYPAIRFGSLSQWAWSWLEVEMQSVWWTNENCLVFASLSFRLRDVLRLQRLLQHNPESRSSRCTDGTQILQETNLACRPTKSTLTRKIPDVSQLPDVYCASANKDTHATLNYWLFHLCLTKQQFIHQTFIRLMLNNIKCVFYCTNCCCQFFLREKWGESLVAAGGLWALRTPTLTSPSKIQAIDFLHHLEKHCFCCWFVLWPVSLPLLQLCPFWPTDGDVWLAQLA